MSKQQKKCIFRLNMSKTGENWLSGPKIPRKGEGARLTDCLYLPGQTSWSAEGQSESRGFEV